MAWLAARVHVGKMRGRGGDDVIDVEGEDVDAPFTPRSLKQKAPAQHTQVPPPPPKAPRTSTPAEHAARERAGGDVAQWQQQQQQQQSEPWQVRAISTEATVRDMEQRLAEANEEKRAAEVERDALRRDKEHLTAKVKTLEREAQRAKGGRALGPTAEGEPEGPTAERAVGGGAPNPAGTRFLLAGAQAWHAQAEATDTCRPLPRACAWHCCRPRWTWRLGRSLPIWAGSHRPTTSLRRRR